MADQDDFPAALGGKRPLALAPPPMSSPRRRGDEGKSRLERAVAEVLETLSIPGLPDDVRRLRVALEAALVQRTAQSKVALGAALDALPLASV